MKAFVCLCFFLIGFVDFSINEELLGGWRQSTNETFNQECLNKALTEIHGVGVGEDLKTQISDVRCQTQIVNGLNIRLTFKIRNQPWRCTFYKSFIETLEMISEGCRTIDDDSTASTTTSPVDVVVHERPRWQQFHHRRPVDDEPIENQQELLAKPIELPKKLPLNDNDDDLEEEQGEDDEAKIDAMKEKVDEGNFVELDE